MKSGCYAKRPWVLMKRLPWSLQTRNKPGFSPRRMPSPPKKSSPVSILHLLLRHIGRAAIKLKLDLKRFYSLGVPKSFISCRQDKALPEGYLHPRMSSRLGHFKLFEMDGSRGVAQNSEFTLWNHTEKCVGPHTQIVWFPLFTFLSPPIKVPSP